MSKFKRFTFLLSLFGLSIFGIGFIYEVMFAGIPYQDPTPALQEKFDHHTRCFKHPKLRYSYICLFLPYWKT